MLRKEKSFFSSDTFSHLNQIEWIWLHQSNDVAQFPFPLKRFCSLFSSPYFSYLHFHCCPIEKNRQISHKSHAKYSGMVWDSSMARDIVLLIVTIQTISIALYEFNEHKIVCSRSSCHYSLTLHSVHQKRLVYYAAIPFSISFVYLASSLFSAFSVRGVSAASQRTYTLGHEKNGAYDMPQSLIIVHTFHYFVFQFFYDFKPVSIDLSVSISWMKTVCPAGQYIE